MSDESAPLAEHRKYRELAGASRWVVDGLLVLLTVLGALWAAEAHHYLHFAVFKEQFLALLLGVGLATMLLCARAHRSESGRVVPWYDWWLALAGLVSTGFVVVRYPALVLDMASVSPERWILGTVAIALVLEATRRLVGWILVILVGIFIFYARFSHVFPGMFYAPGTEWPRLATYLYLDTNSLFGLPLGVMASILIAFILFGRVLFALNADKVLTDLALASMGRYRGGPAKVAVAASSLFGTFSGSVVSNVVMDGPITIPMMTRAGYRSHDAAAIEAVASTGGQIMPPVMGIAAFIIADWLNISYGEVILAAAIPAVLYYVALFMQVDLLAARAGLSGYSRDAVPRLWPVLMRGWVFVLPIAVLIYTLVALMWQPGRSAMAAVAVALVVGFLRPESRPRAAALVRALRDTGRTVLDLVAITAVAGLIIGTMQISGLAFNLSLILVLASGQNLMLLLVVAALLSILLGMGMPTTVIYILLAILVAPGLVEFGVPDLAAHLFLFYFGMLSMITPPVCLATFAAATIAGCNFWKAGWAGVRIGIVAYLIPFMFVFHPELLLIGSAGEIVLAAVTAVVGVMFLAAAVVGYLRRALSPALRIGLLLAGLCLIPSPNQGAEWLAVNLAGFALGATIAVVQRPERRSPRSA